LEKLIKQDFPLLAVVKDHPNYLEGREEEDIRKFCSDLLSSGGARATGGRVLSLVQQSRRQPPAIDSRVTTILFARELEGKTGFGRTRRYVNFQNDLLRALEDELSLIAQFANCAGDVATISWVSNDNLICGTTTHSDSHNQQYNKPGNLLLCSSRQASLRAFPDHRIPRPVVSSGDNATHEMIQSQDPWLYASVVSSDYDPVQKRAYTSSFDRTVKVWRTDDEGRLMDCLATWYHDGNVNFVAAAKDGSGRVASAADVPTHAVRIYTVNEDNIAESAFESFSCSRTDADTEKWAYYPATMQWGKAHACQHILAIGYSPRSLSGEDSDIPDDRTNTGEIMLWDANNACRIPLMTATTANVFEIVWHPTQPRFLAATSPCGLTVEPGTRTQIHIFQRDQLRDDHVYCEYQSLDCVASDINELTFMPNSLKDAYVTAACTNGRVYVWDTAQPGQPVHILEHGTSLEGFDDEIAEKWDTGVKFTAWGKTPDRFYTGSSDGVVRVWNVRNRRKPFVRALLEAPAPISSGAFSPDMDKLAIGDAAGRLYLFSLDQRDAPERRYLKLPDGRKVQIPIPFIPHAEPSPPSPYPSAAYPSANMDNGDPMVGLVSTGEHSGEGGIRAGRAFLESKMLVATGDRAIGVVQGPNYAQTGLFRKEAHESEDPFRPLLTTFEKIQQDSMRSDRGLRRRSLRRLRDPGSPERRHEAAHRVNASWEKEVLQALTEADLADLAEQGAILSLYDFDDNDERELIYESGSEC
jgi:WD40 repeat protein